MDLHII